MDATTLDPADPHANSRWVTAGPAPEAAGRVLILLHGRGASAGSILSILPQLRAEHFAVIAPQAAGNTWYPHSFLAPLASNQPFLDSALRRIETIVSQLLARGIASDRIALLGFSQGACLASEFAARHARSYGAVMGLSGGLIGPTGTPRNYPGSLNGTPVFLGCGDPDPHIPFKRVTESAEVLRRMGATVDLRRYQGMPHAINDDELEACRGLLRTIGSPKNH